MISDRPINIEEKAEKNQNEELLEARPLLQASKMGELASSPQKTESSLLPLAKGIT